MAEEFTQTTNPEPAPSDSAAEAAAAETADEVAETQDAEQAAALQELIQLNDQRMATYGMLSRMYRVEMDADTLHEMHEMLFPAATGSANTDKGYRLIAQYLSRAWDNSLLDLAIDYARTFIGDSNELDGAAFPYESVYTSERHLIMQEARDEVLAIYRAYGMKKDDSWKESEDHIAVELEFMKAICQRISALLKDGNEDEAYRLLKVQLNFLKKHLQSWTPLLTADMRHFAKTDFYQGLAYLTDGFLETDREFLEDILNED